MSKDTVYRQDAIRLAEQGQIQGFEWQFKKLCELPSAQPEPKKGKWKGYNDGDPNWQRDDGSPIFLICSECHETVINNGSAHWNFCPNCGADMRGDSE